MVLFAGFILPCSDAYADTAFAIPERFRLSVAGTTSEMDTEASVGTSTGGANVMLLFEDLLGLPVHKGFLEIDGSWRISGRHHLDAGYMDIERTSQRQIESEFPFGDYTFHTGATVEASFGSRFIYAAYRYDMLRTDPVRISVTAGVNATRLTVGLSGSGDITDSQGNAVTGTASVEGRAPLPVPLFGFQLDWRVGRHSEVQAYQRFVGYSSDEIRGSMTQSKLRYHYFVTPNLGLGLGYETTSLRLPRYKSDDRTLRFGYNFQGVTFYLQGAF
jgi:hypothetical protein